MCQEEVTLSRADRRVVMVWPVSQSVSQSASQPAFSSTTAAPSTRREREGPHAL